MTVICQTTIGSHRLTGIFEKEVNKQYPHGTKSDGTVRVFFIPGESLTIFPDVAGNQTVAKKDVV